LRVDNEFFCGFKFQSRSMLWISMLQEGVTIGEGRDPEGSAT
jgi:hypothetical protein